jgi:hypothetical protein
MRPMRPMLQALQWSSQRATPPLLLVLLLLLLLRLLVWLLLLCLNLSNPMHLCLQSCSLLGCIQQVQGAAAAQAAAHMCHRS